MGKFVYLFLASLTIFIAPATCSDQPDPTLSPEQELQDENAHYPLGKWLPVSNETYEQAIIVDKLGVILCRVKFGKELIPGWELYPYPGCTFGYRKKALSMDSYEHLVIPPDEDQETVYIWEREGNGTICESPIVGGISAKGEPYFVCRANDVDGIPLSGKLQRSRAACLVPIRTKEVKFSSYEVLCQIDTSDIPEEEEEGQ